MVNKNVLLELSVEFFYMDLFWFFNKLGGNFDRWECFIIYYKFYRLDKKLSVGIKCYV